MSRKKKKRPKDFAFGRVGIQEGASLTFTAKEGMFLYDKSELFLVAGAETEVLCTYSGEVEDLREWTKRLLTKAGIPYREDSLEPKRHWE